MPLCKPEKAHLVEGRFSPMLHGLDYGIIGWISVHSGPPLFRHPPEGYTLCSCVLRHAQCEREEVLGVRGITPADHI